MDLIRHTWDINEVTINILIQKGSHHQYHHLHQPHRLMYWNHLLLPISCIDILSTSSTSPVYTWMVRNLSYLVRSIIGYANFDTIEWVLHSGQCEWIRIIEVTFMNHNFPFIRHTSVKLCRFKTQDRSFQFDDYYPLGYVFQCCSSFHRMRCQSGRNFSLNK